MPKKKMRLVVWKHCPRNCEGCCNKDYDFSKIPMPMTYKGYDEIILTGGEPLTNPDVMAVLADKVRANADPGTRILLYTAVYSIEAHRKVLPHVDGVTITLHEQADVEPFMFLCHWLRGHRWAYEKSLRLNVFKGIIHPDVCDVFHVKSGIVWLKDCPLPSGEELMYLGN